jgi:hypothetical protein
MTPAWLLRHLASVARHAPSRMRAYHLEQPALELAAHLERADRVHLGIHAPTKAAILTEWRALGLAGEDAEPEYRRMLALGGVLDRLGLAVCPALPARLAYVGGEAEEEAELVRYSHLAGD